MKKGADVFEEYFKKYFRQVTGYLQKKIGSPQDAEDLAMEAFSACYEHFNSFNKDKASFGTWLYVIVNNKLKNYFRNKKLFEEIDDEIFGAESFEEEVIHTQYIQSLRNELANALLQLNETQRNIIVLKYFKGIFLCS